MKVDEGTKWSELARLGWGPEKKQMKVRTVGKILSDEMDNKRKATARRGPIRQEGRGNLKLEGAQKTPETRLGVTIAKSKTGEM